MSVADEWGNEMGHCNSCGEEAEMGSECCEDGEVVEYDDEDDPVPVGQSWGDVNGDNN